MTTWAAVFGSKLTHSKLDNAVRVLFICCSWRTRSLLFLQNHIVSISPPLTRPPSSSPCPVSRIPGGCTLKWPHVYLNLEGQQLSAWCPIHFLWCFLIASQPWSHSSAGLSVATARRAKQHFTTMSVTSALHTNQRVCQREAQLQRRRRREEVEK